ncbi:MAG: DeoR/GlpR family DNA-binding transcription regulator [Lachnospiraceae bacterium]
MQERRQEILRLLEGNGRVKVCELSREFKCSEVTIRSDIRAMEQEGFLIRTHGGALPIEERKIKRKYDAESIYRYQKQKREIAACAYEYIKDRDTIIIDDASSSFYLAEFIKRHSEKQLAVVTNSLLVGNELAHVNHVQLFMIGGQVGGNQAATLGDTAVQNLKNIRVDRAFIGVHGINFDVGITSIGSPQMQVKQAILKSADKTYVLADSKKFGGGYLQVICPLKDIYKVITDRNIKEGYIYDAEKANLSLVIAKNILEYS